MTRAADSSALSTASAWLCRLSPIPWMAGLVLFWRGSRETESFRAAGTLVLCFVSLSLAVVGFFGLLRHHSRAAVERTRPPLGVMILGALGVLGGMVVAMSSVLLADLAESGGG